MANAASKANLSPLTYVAYGGGNLAANLLVTTASTFITYFYTEQVGLSIGVAGAILAGCRVFDGITDLFMGAVVDKTKSRYGKARPWLLRLAIPYLLACLMLFSSPMTGGIADIVYAVISYVLAVCVIYTGISVPYNTLSMRITKHQGQRTLLSVFRTFFGFGGAALVGSVSLKVVAALGGGRMGWTLMGLVYGILGMLLYLFTFKACKELPDDFVLSNQDAEKKTKVVKTSTRESLHALIHNKYWILLMTTTFLSFISSGLTGVNVYYAQFILQSTDYMGLITLCSMLPIMIGALGMAPLVSKFGGRNVCLVGSACSLTGCLIVMIHATSPVFLGVGLVVKNLGASALAVCGFSMMGDTVEYSDWKFHVRPDGLSYSAVTFGEKVGAALGTVIVSGLMASTGYIQKAEVQTDLALFGIKAIFLYIPIIISIISIVLMAFYDLDQKYDQILEDLKARQAREE